MSGFFGSGKSPSPRCVGYLLANPTLEAARRPSGFAGPTRTSSRRCSTPLTRRRRRSPCSSIWPAAADMLREGESLVLPVYRALLERLGYSPQRLLAELEIAPRGRRSARGFETATFEATDGATRGRRSATSRWRKNYASRALHLIDRRTSRAPTRGPRQATRPNIDHNWFANRALELLAPARRRRDAPRLRRRRGRPVRRAKHPAHVRPAGPGRGVPEEAGPLWLVVTSQERLSDVVDSLESRRSSRPRPGPLPAARRPAPQRHHEVTSRRVLDKTDAGQGRPRALWPRTATS